MPGVFISYRRDDSAGFAGALERELATRFGPEFVFMDIKDIEGGTDFPVAIDEAIKSSEVVLILTGSRWLDAKDEHGVRRLEKPGDFVRQEIARALKTQARVIPVLLDGTNLPLAEQLPQDLQPLTTRQALELRNSHWDEDMARLLNHVREGMYAASLQEASGKKIELDFNPTPPGHRTVKLLLGVTLAMGLIFVAFGIALLVSQVRFLAGARNTDARIVNLLPERADDGSYTYRPQLEYVTPAGQTVHTPLDTVSNRSAYHVGELVPILFDPDQPEHAIPNTFWSRWLFVVIFGGIGIVVSGSTSIPSVLRAIRRHRIRGLLKKGRPIVTAYHSVEENAAVEVQGLHPFYVITEWRNPVSHELVQFRSPALWQDPRPIASDQLITVVIDPDNFHCYLMDLSFLHGRAAPRVRRL